MFYNFLPSIKCSAQVLFNVLRFLKLYVNFSNFELYPVLTYTPLLVLIQLNL